MKARGNSKSTDLFTALGHPLRRRILRKMLAGELETSPRELAADLGEPLSALSYHVRVLAECGAIELIRTHRVRGSTQHVYRSTAVAAWAQAALTETDDRAARGRRRRRSAAEGEETT